MEMNELRRAIVRSAVHKGIREVREDPHRGVRKLVDLGSHFADGRFQKQIFELMQKELLNRNSAYYRMVVQMVENVRPEYLESFGMNIGYNSWTHGAQIIRQHEAKYGYNVPWCLVLDLSGDIAFDVDDLMKQGEELGIYSYFIFGGEKSSVASLFPVFRKHSDCAVFLMLNSAQLPDVNIENVENVLVFLPADDDGAAASAQDLLERKCCFGLWTCYEKNNARRILSGEMEQRAEELSAAAVIAVPTQKAGTEIRQTVQAYADRARKEKRYICFLMNLLGDIERIDRVISVESCMLRIESDGTATTAQGRHENLSVRSIALEDVLMCTMPRVTYNTDKTLKE